LTIKGGGYLDANVETAQGTPAISVGSASETSASSAAAAPQSGDATPPKPAYPGPAPVPTQEGPKGVRFDFNEGCRVVLPESEHPWKVRISDLDTGNILYETEIKAGRVSSTKRYYVRFRIEVGQQGENLFTHEYSAEGQAVLIQFPIGTLGDTLGWFPYAVKFQEQHKCRVTCAMAERLIPLFRGTHPQIEFVTHEAVDPER